MLPIVEKPKTVRDLGPIDARALTERVLAVSQRSWELEDERKENAFSVFHHTRHIVLRFTPGNRDPQDYYDTPGWAVWNGLVQPVIDQALAAYDLAQPEVSKAMFARLLAGHKIDLHIDGAGSNLRTHKIHVPLTTNPGALFLSGEEGFHLAAGRAWEVNNISSHGGINSGSEDRIHFIFEVFDRASLREAADLG